MMEPEQTDWIKIIAIFGPVCGVMLGAFGSWLQQRYFLRHADKTRFHELRVEVYAKYLYIANKIVLDFVEGKRDNDDLENVMQLASKVSLIASADIRTQVVNVNDTIRQMSENLPSINEYKAAYQLHTRSFISAVRQELDP